MRCWYVRLAILKARSRIALAFTSMGPHLSDLPGISDIVNSDHRKLQSRLLTKWPTIPIEVEPLARDTVISALRALGSPAPAVREGHMSKAGPIKTDQDNFIIDAPFPTLLLPLDVLKSTSLHATQKGMEGKGGGIWEVKELAREIKLIEGVLSVGLFVGENGAQAQMRGANQGGQKPVAAYFGMADGSVVVREANQDGSSSVRTQKQIE